MNPYAVLGVSQQASLEECKSAYRRLVIKYHPDRGGDKDKFLEITEAYNLIKEGKGTVFSKVGYTKPRTYKVVHTDLFNFRTVEI